MKYPINLIKFKLLELEKSFGQISGSGRNIFNVKLKEDSFNALLKEILMDKKHEYCYSGGIITLCGIQFEKYKI